LPHQEMIEVEGNPIRIRLLYQLLAKVAFSSLIKLRNTSMAFFALLSGPKKKKVKLD